MTIPSEVDEKLLEIIKPEAINAYLWYVSPFNVLKMIEVLRREEAERKEAAVAEAVREALSKLSNDENLSNLVLRIIYEVSQIKEPINAHILEATDSVIKAIKFFARIEGGMLHFSTLEDRVKNVTTPQEGLQERT